MKKRLDQTLLERGITTSRSQAETYIKLGYVYVNDKLILRPSFYANPEDKIRLNIEEQYVSRAALKLQSVVTKLKVNFKDKLVMDVGSSTGGFSDFALKNGATKVIAIEVGTNQMNKKLSSNPRIELHEKTDVRDIKQLSSTPDIVLIDVSFISLREILPAVYNLASQNTQILAMFKPQFEAKDKLKHKGVIKNDHIRRELMTSFEKYLKQKFIIIDQADSDIHGAKGNIERFYLLKII